MIDASVGKLLITNCPLVKFVLLETMILGTIKKLSLVETVILLFGLEISIEALPEVSKLILKFNMMEMIIKIKIFFIMFSQSTLNISI